MTKPTKPFSSSSKPTSPITRERRSLTEIAALKQRMLNQSSPGARLIIKRMEALDASLLDLHSRVGAFTPGDHRKRYEADPVTRRYIYQKKNDLMAELVVLMWEVAKAVEPFALTEENTKLLPEPAYMTAWSERCRREKLLQARYVRIERAARRRIRAQVNASPTASCPTKTKRGSDI